MENSSSFKLNWIQLLTILLFLSHTKQREVFE